MNSLPQIGGGFTLENDLVDAVLRVAPSRHHEWVVFLRYQPASASTTRIRVVKLERPLVAGSMRWLLSASGVQRLSGGALGWQASGHERAVRGAGIDVLWNVGPYTLSAEVPYWTTIFDLQHRESPYFPEVSGRGEWERRDFHYSRLLGRATGVFTGTQEGVEQVQRYYPASPAGLHVLPLPTPSFALAAGASEDYESETSLKEDPRPMLFYPAQFWPHKNHVNVLHALKRLTTADGMDLRLVLVGSDKGNLSYVKDCVRLLNLQDRVSFLGFVERDQLLRLYRRAAVTVFASLFGPDNLPPLEAAALGCPVVLADVPGAREQLKDAVHIVDGRNPEALAGGIKRVLTDLPFRTALVQAGRLRARAWTADDYVHQAVNTIEAFGSTRMCWPS